MVQLTMYLKKHHFEHVTTRVEFCEGERYLVYVKAEGKEKRNVSRWCSAHLKDDHGRRYFLQTNTTPGVIVASTVMEESSIKQEDLFLEGDTAPGICMM